MNAPKKLEEGEIAVDENGNILVSPADFADLQAQLKKLAKKVKKLEKEARLDQVTIVVFSGDMDRLMAAFIIATGAAAMGMEVTMFFTFWGLTALKKQTIFKGKKITEKMMAMMLPGGPASVGTSRLNMMGLGPVFFKKVMKDHNVQTVPDLVELAKELDIKMMACQMSMGVMGITREEMMDGVNYCGVGGYLDEALDAKLSLFI